MSAAKGGSGGQKKQNKMRQRQLFGADWLAGRHHMQSKKGQKDTKTEFNLSPGVGPAAVGNQGIKLSDLQYP